VQLGDYFGTPFVCRQKLALRWRIIHDRTLRAYSLAAEQTFGNIAVEALRDAIVANARQPVFMANA
jgi:hypothetical protein